MGLDMFLTRKKYIGAIWEHRNIKGVIYLTYQDKEIPIDFDKITYIEEQVGYWRKANAIHKWFVDNVQKGVDDCRYAWVSSEDLEKLLKVCKEVKKKAILKEDYVQVGTQFDNEGNPTKIMERGKVIENGEEIQKILPTNDGFFFGSTDYDQWYMENIDYTIKMLTEVLKEEKKLNEAGFYSDFIYHSSW